MDFTLILNSLRHGLEFAKQLLPLADILGGSSVAKAVDTVKAVTEMVENVQARIAEGKIVADSTDQARISHIISDLQAVNDKLAEYIERS